MLSKVKCGDPSPSLLRERVTAKPFVCCQCSSSRALAACHRGCCGGSSIMAVRGIRLGMRCPPLHAQLLPCRCSEHAPQLASCAARRAWVQLCRCPVLAPQQACARHGSCTSGVSERKRCRGVHARARENVQPPWEMLFDLRERETEWTETNQVRPPGLAACRSAGCCLELLVLRLRLAEITFQSAARSLPAWHLPESVRFA